MRYLLLLIFLCLTFKATIGCLDGFYECENGECIFRSDRCNGKKDCTDGSDEGADNCGDVIGGVIGGVLGGILVCCICPAILCACGIYWTNKINRRNGTVIRRTHLGSFTTPSVPPNTTHTAASHDQQQEVNPEEVSTISAQPKDPELYDAEPPPSYPATQYTTYPSSPPGYDTSVPGYSIGFEMQGIGTDGHLTSGNNGGDGDGGSFGSGSCGGGDGGTGSGGGGDD